MPHVPQDVLDRLAALEREVRQLRGRAQMRPALNEVLHGDVVIGEGGRLIVRDPDGDPVFETGQSATHGDYYTRLRRDNGALALTIGANSFEDDDAPSQMVRLWSRGGDIIVMDDYYAPRWLGRPWMPVQLHPTARAATYSGTGYDVAWTGTGPLHNPVLIMRVQTFSGTGGGQVRVELTSGSTVVVDEWDTAANAWTTRTITYPLDGRKAMDTVALDVRHRAKTGGQNIETRVLSAYTRNTFTANEAPDAPLSAAAAPPEEVL